MAKALVLVLFLAFLQGCSTGTATSEPMNEPLNAVYASVESNLTMGIQSYSENRREILSRPFVIKTSTQKKPSKFHDRGRARVIINGSERPYTIETQVYIERASSLSVEDDHAYSIVRYDHRLAAKLLKNILATLKKDTRDKNVIDDFRSF
jgi:hypothetical protein